MRGERFLERLSNPSAETPSGETPERIISTLRIILRPVFETPQRAIYGEKRPDVGRGAGESYQTPTPGRGHRRPSRNARILDIASEMQPLAIAEHTYRCADRIRHTMYLYESLASGIGVSWKAE